MYKYFQALPSDIKDEFTNFIIALSRTKTDDAFVDVVFKALANPRCNIKFYFCSKQPVHTKKILLDKLNEFIADFEIKIRGVVNPRVKMEAIIALIQQCEQLHPFSDGNCRVFCMLLLNHLLIKYGFPLAVLHDPNRFDGFSREELLKEVLHGMENTFTLLRQKRIYGIGTAHVIAMLKSKNKTDMLDYFNELNMTLLLNSEARGLSSHMP